MTFKDHFSSLAGSYAAGRPGYPDALFQWLAALCPVRELAWDCGAGSGQASLGLAEHFSRVIATDASAAQLAQAPRHDRIDYRVAPAEASGLAAAEADLVVVAQALHWFELEPFYAEVRRVLKPAGVIAVWTYGVIAVGEDAGDAGNQADRIVQHFYRDVIGPYWPPERRHVETGYRDLAFPFATLPPASFAMTVSWRLADLVRYTRTWSATSRFEQARGVDPVPALEAELVPVWGALERVREIRWPLSIRVGRP
jgi:SAM-dependent methyltransferase